ncbi:unnamed protein product [Penicillium bialowiezense]
MKIRRWRQAPMEDQAGSPWRTARREESDEGEDGRLARYPQYDASKSTKFKQSMDSSRAAAYQIRPQWALP